MFAACCQGHAFYQGNKSMLSYQVNDLFNSDLKGHCHEILDSWFFLHQSTLSLLVPDKREYTEPAICETVFIL
jgi:hypothetical protein